MLPRVHLLFASMRLSRLRLRASAMPVGVSLEHRLFAWDGRQCWDSRTADMAWRDVLGLSIAWAGIPKPTYPRHSLGSWVLSKYASDQHALGSSQLVPSRFTAQLNAGILSAIGSSAERSAANAKVPLSTNSIDLGARVAEVRNGAFLTVAADASE